MIVREVEDVLTKELSLGVEAHVIARGESITPKKTRFLSLAHRRVNGKFCIAILKRVETQFVNENNILDYCSEVEDETPWAQSSRDEKLETFPCLPKLLENLIQNVETATEQLEKTQATVREILGTVNCEPKAAPGETGEIVPVTGQYAARGCCRVLKRLMQGTKFPNCPNSNKECRNSGRRTSWEWVPPGGAIGLKDV
jgi:hypothetical protein